MKNKYIRRNIILKFMQLGRKYQRPLTDSMANGFPCTWRKSPAKT